MSSLPYWGHQDGSDEIVDEKELHIDVEAANKGDVEDAISSINGFQALTNKANEMDPSLRTVSHEYYSLKAEQDVIEGEEAGEGGDFHFMPLKALPFAEQKHPPGSLRVRSNSRSLQNLTSRPPLTPIRLTRINPTSFLPPPSPAPRAVGSTNTDE